MLLASQIFVRRTTRGMRMRMLLLGFAVRRTAAAPKDAHQKGLKRGIFVAKGRQPFPILLSLPFLFFSTRLVQITRPAGHIEGAQYKGRIC